MRTTFRSPLPSIRLPHRFTVAALGLTVAGSLVAVLAVPAQAVTTPTAMPGGKIYAGAAGDTATLASKTGTTVGVHKYGTFEGAVPTGRMVTANTSASWRTVANAKPGSSLYTNIVRWATTIKARNALTLLAFGHEPEVASKTYLGTPAEYRAAFARVVTIFRQQGATNVKFTLQLTAWAYRAKATDRVYASNWYPGDAYVDVVGADAYNWSTCGEGRGLWVELKTLVDPVLAFGKSHGKLVALPEFGATKDYRRATWLTNAKNYVIANESWFAAVYYFNRPPTNTSNLDCSWALNTSAEYAAYGSLLKNVNFTF